MCVDQYACVYVWCVRGVCGDQYVYVCVWWWWCECVVCVRGGAGDGVWISTCARVCMVLLVFVCVSVCRARANKFVCHHRVFTVP